jgi:hypothetical protein
MPRIRTVKPNFWGHPDPPSPWARLLFLAMLNWADDEGVGTANPKELAAFAFPNDEEIDSRRTTVLLREVSRSFEVVFYTVGGRPYFAMTDWHKHQKVNNPAKEYYHPRPDQAETWLYQEECDDYGSPTVVLPEDSVRTTTQEIGNRKLEVGSTSGPVQKNRSVSNARERDDHPVDHMGRSEMSLTLLAGGQETPEPPPPDRRIPTEATATVRAVLPPEIGRKIRWSCEIQIATLLNQGVEESEGEATLREWFATDKDMHPGNIPYVHAKRVQRRTQPRQPVTGTDRAIQELDAIAEKYTAQQGEIT